MARDYFGRLKPVQSDNTLDEPKIYELAVVVNGTTTSTYKRFYNTNPCRILKDTVVNDADGNTQSYKCEFADGNWANRTSLTYRPINECWDYSQTSWDV